MTQKYDKYDKASGSRAEVMHGTAHHTTGGLTKDKLMYNKSDRIVSKKKHFNAKKEKRLVNAGYITKKGQFGFIKIDVTPKIKTPKKKTPKNKTNKNKGKGKKNKSKKMRGGMILSPAEV